MPLRPVVLVVEDDEEMNQLQREFLDLYGLDTEAVYNGADALDAGRLARTDAVLLDLMLPEIDGMAVCTRIREHSGVPIVMLTARSAEDDRVAGLNRGADDYVTKPFRMRELCARLAAVLRRSRHWDRDEEVLEVGDLYIRPAAREAGIGARVVDLTPKEFDLLEHLARNADHVLGREKILERVWGEGQYLDERTLDVHIRWLREKIEDDPSNPERLITVRGVGYMLTSGA